LGNSRVSRFLARKMLIHRDTVHNGRKAWIGTKQRNEDLAHGSVL